VKRKTDEIAGDHSEDSNAEKKVQLIMSTATLTKVTITLARRATADMWSNVWPS
jgi:hypothetical protein